MNAPRRIGKNTKLSRESHIKTLMPLPTPADPDIDATETLEDNRPEARTHQHLQALADQHTDDVIHDERPLEDHVSEITTTDDPEKEHKNVTKPEPSKVPEAKKELEARKPQEAVAKKKPNAVEKKKPEGKQRPNTKNKAAHKNKLAVTGKKKPEAAGKKTKENKTGPPDAAAGQQTKPSTKKHSSGDATPPKAAASLAMKAKATSGNQLVDFMRSSPTVMSQNISSLGNAMTANMNQQAKATLEAQPKISMKTSGSPDGGASVPPTLNKAAAPPKPIVLKKGPVPKYNNSVPTQHSRQDPSHISTSIGAKPKLQATGSADPKLTEQASKAGNTEADAAHVESLATIHSNNGEERVQPQQMELHKQAVLPAPVKMDQPAVSSEVLGYATQDLPGSVRTLSDKALKAKMESQLAANDQKVEAAVAKRDLDNQQAMEAAQTQAAKESAAAQAQQDAAVAQGRAAISSKKDEAAAETEGVMHKYKGQVTAKHKETMDKANKTIADHQKRADAEMAKGEQKAQAEKRKAEAEAARERQEAQRKKDKMHWWQKVGSFFSSLWSALSRAITAIVSVVTHVVTTVLKAAKNLAIGILNAATKILTVLIDQFTKALKAFLSVALASFPGIRVKLFAAIDAVVSAVKQVMDKVISSLKNTLTNLIDTLSKAYAFVASVFKAAMTAALAVATAIVKGRFSSLPMILFRAACEAAGIPPEPVIEILKNAADAFMDIIKHPINFVKNLFKATALGIKQFAKGLPKKLLGGLMSWLFGKLAEAGIELPKTWDLPSVFMLILKVLGLTLANVKARATAILGAKNMARIEFVIEQAKTLFTKSPAAVWDHLKAKAHEMKEAALKEINTWLITRVIGGLIEKFSPPVVGAIIGAIQMIMAMVGKAKQILQLMAAVSKSMKLIALGSLGAAANKIDSVLTQSIPLVINMAMGFLGITGLAQKVQDAILKLQEPANQAIDFIIKKFIALAKSAMSAVKKAGKKVVKKVKGLWQGRKDFTTKDGEEHAVYVDGTGKDASIVVNPVPKQEVSAYLDKAEKNLPENDEFKAKVQADLSQARSLLSTIEGDMVDVDTSNQKATEEDSKSKTPKPATTHETGPQKQAQSDIDELATILKRIMDATGVAMESDDTNWEEAEPEAKKAAAAEAIETTFQNKTFTQSEIDEELQRVKKKYALSEASFDVDNSRIALAASPATFLPVEANAVPPSLQDGVDRHVNDTDNTVAATGNYLKATHFDGPFPSPADEVDEGLHRFADIGIEIPLGDSGLKTLGNAPRRPGRVEALLSSYKNEGRAEGDTTSYGHLGVDEEKIIKGTNSVSYDGGHLVGDQLMDSHHSFNLFEDWNLAPQVENFNRAAYLNVIEKPVAKAIKNAGATVSYTVQVQYPDDTYSIDPLNLAANLWGENSQTANQIRDAIIYKKAPNEPLELKRRTPGYWWARAQIKEGGPIQSGNINQYKNVSRTMEPDDVRDNEDYSPPDGEHAIYLLTVDGNVHESSSRAFEAAPSAEAAQRINYVAQNSVEITSRQKTFDPPAPAPAEQAAASAGLPAAPATGGTNGSPDDQQAAAAPPAAPATGLSSRSRDDESEARQWPYDQLAAASPAAPPTEGIGHSPDYHDHMAAWLTEAMPEREGAEENGSNQGMGAEYKKVKKPGRKLRNDGDGKAPIVRNDASLITKPAEETSSTNRSHMETVTSADLLPEDMQNNGGTTGTAKIESVTSRPSKRKGGAGAELPDEGNSSEESDSLPEEGEPDNIKREKEDPPPPSNDPQAKEGGADRPDNS